MAHQSPMISIPKKSTDEVDWTTPIRHLIAQSYGESPDNYSAECAALQRCRQDAVRGAGSDMTARDLLYKYFGQLELLELRFSEIRVNFAWRDAFTNKLTTQTSIAFEKASILFQIASTHSAIAASQNRSDPEGLKRSFYYFKTCAGMLTYINENFLHAPSTDLSRDVIKFLVNVILVQATEVFFEKCADEKKGNALVAKIGSQAASMYTSLSEDVKEFMGKGIFDRNWVTIIQVKAKYFTSLAHYYRALADNTSGKHGDALVRFTLAETLAKEANRISLNFASVFVTTMSPNLPTDAGPSIQERTKAHLALCTDRKSEAQRENDLIYNAILPSADALPVIEKLTVATPIPIQDVYGTPEVQKVIGADMFVKLIPLSVHESASVYSEEKAKLVRGEVEKAEGAEGEARSAIDGMGVKEGLSRFKSMAEGSVGGEDEIPLEVRRWRDDIALVEDREGVNGIFTELNRLKDSVKRELESISRDLEIETRDCELMRVKYEHKWTQEPSASLTKSLRQDLKSHLEALDAAGASDKQVTELWESVKGDTQLLLSQQLEDLFRARGGSTGEHLLDLDPGDDATELEEKNSISHFVSEIEERLGRLNKISHERNEVLKDLKEKIQTDDVSHLLLLNRRNSGVEPTLFAAELEKFRPYQQRLAASVHHQQVTLQEVGNLWKGLKDLAGRGPGAKKWDERERRKKDTVRRFSRARDGYMEVRDGLAKGLQFYTQLTDLTGSLKQGCKQFINNRARERDMLVGQLEAERRLSSATSRPPPLAAKPPQRPPPPPSNTSLDSQFGSMSLQGNAPSPSPWGHQPYSSTAPPPAQPPPPNMHSYSPSLPPPPPPQKPVSRPSAPYADPYASLGSLGSQFNPPPSAPAHTSSPYQQQPNPSYPPPSTGPSAPSPYQQHPHHLPPQQSSFPPPPPLVSYSYGGSAPPRPPPPNQQQQQYPYQQQQGYGGYSQGYGQ